MQKILKQRHITSKMKLFISFLYYLIFELFLLNCPSQIFGSVQNTPMLVYGTVSLRYQSFCSRNVFCKYQPVNGINDYEQKTLYKNLVLIVTHVSRSNLCENCYDFATLKNFHHTHSKTCTTIAKQIQHNKSALIDYPKYFIPIQQNWLSKKQCLMPVFTIMTPYLFCRERKM